MSAQEITLLLIIGVPLMTARTADHWVVCPGIEKFPFRSKAEKMKRAIFSGMPVRAFVPKNCLAFL